MLIPCLIWFQEIFINILKYFMTLIHIISGLLSEQLGQYLQFTLSAAWSKVLIRTKTSSKLRQVKWVIVMSTQCLWYVILWYQLSEGRLQLKFRIRPYDIVLTVVKIQAILIKTKSEVDFPQMLVSIFFKSIGWIGLKYIHIKCARNNWLGWTRTGFVRIQYELLFWSLHSSSIRNKKILRIILSVTV